MAKTIQQQLFQHLKHMHGSTLAPLAHALPAEYFASVPDGFQIPFRMAEHTSLREQLMHAWMAVGQLSGIPTDLPEIDTLSQRLSGLLSGFETRNSMSRTGVSYAVSAGDALSEHDDTLPRFMQACAQWFQRELHSVGSVAWAEMANQWLEHFSTALARYATSLPNAVLEGDSVCFVQASEAVDPELLRACHAIRTQKIVMVLQQTNDLQISVHCSKRDAQALGAAIQDNPDLPMEQRSTGIHLILPWSDAEMAQFQVEGETPLELFMALDMPDHPLHKTAQVLDTYFDHAMGPTEPLSVSTADLMAVDAVHRALRRDDRKAIGLQLPIHLELHRHQFYWASLDHAEPTMIQLDELVHHPRFQSIQSCWLWSDPQKNACVHVSLTALRSLPPEAAVYGRLIQDRPGHFLLRHTDAALSHKPWPTLHSARKRQHLETFEALYNQTNQYIRDPLSPAMIRRTLQSAGLPTPHTALAMDALAMHMRKHDVNTHLSFETRADGTSGQPYFVSMNIYRVLEDGAGVDCRSVSAFVRSHEGAAIVLGEHTMAADGLSNEDLQRLGMDSTEVDALFEKAINRATASHQHRFTSQWENASHQSRQLIPMLPRLMASVARQPAIDTLRLARTHELTSFPTYVVDIPVTSALKVRFDDAWGSPLPMTLHGFLASDTCHSLASSDGLFLLQKSGDGFWLTDQRSRQSYELPFDAEGLKTLSLKQAKTGMSYHNPSQSGAVLDRAKVASLLDHTAPALEEAGRFKIPAFISRDAAMWSRANTLATTFTQWSLTADLKQPLELQLQQLIDILPEHSAFHMDQVLAGGVGAEAGRMFLNDLQTTDPSLLDAMQYGYADRDLRAAARTPRSRLNPQDTAFTLRHLLRWNISQFHRQNPQRVSHYQQMPFLLKVLNEIEPNTKLLPAELVADVAARFAIPVATVQQFYRMAYLDQQTDPMIKSYLPSKELQLPLMRELLARDTVLWHRLATRAQDPEFYPDLALLHQSLAKDAIYTQLQWWVESHLHASLRLSRRTQSHRREHGTLEAIRLRLPLFEGHHQHLVIQTQKQLSDDTLHHTLLPTLSVVAEALRLQNSLKNMHGFQRKDLSFPQELRTRNTQHLVQTLTSPRMQTAFMHLDSFMQQLEATDLYVEDEEPAIQMFNALALYSVGQGVLPSPTAISTAQRQLLKHSVMDYYQYHTHHAMPDALLQEVEQVLDRSVRRTALRTAVLDMQRSLPAQYVLIDDTASRHNALSEIYQEAGVASERCTKQQLVSTLMPALTSLPYGTAELLELQLFASSGEMPKQGSEAKRVLNDIFDIYRSPRIISLSPRLQHFADSMRLSIQDPCTLHRDFLYEHPDFQPVPATPQKDRTITPLPPGLS